MNRSRMLRLAVALWIVLGVVIWNVVFDRMLVVSGRQYSQAATQAFRREGRYELVNEWMRPATTRAVWIASAVSGGVTAIGLLAVAFAGRRRT